MRKFSSFDFHEIYDIFPIGIAYLDENFNVFRANKILCEYFKKSEENLINRHYLNELTHPQCLKQEQALIEEMNRGERNNYQITKKFSLEKNKFLEAEVTVSSVKKKNGEISHYIVSFLDISEKEEIKENLRLNESKYRQVTESLPQLVWTCEADGPCDYLGPQWIQYTGIEEKEQLGFGWLNQLHPDDVQRTQDHWMNTAAKGLDFEIRFRIRRHDGVYRWFHTLAKPLKDESGKIIKWFGSNTDIDDLVNAEENLRLNESKYRQVTESLPQLVWTCEADGPCDYLGPQWIQYTGIEEKEQLGFGWLNQLHPDDVQRTQDHWMNTAAKGLDFEIRFRIRRHDGVYRWFHTLAKPLKDESGKIIKWFGSNTDIDDLVKSEERLESAVEERTHQLKLTMNAAQDANQAKADFLSNMSHELRTPLNAIKGFCQLLEMDKDISEKNKHYVNLLSTASTHLLELVSDILDMAKIEASHIELNLKSNQIDTIISDCLEFVKGLCLEKDVHLEPYEGAGLISRCDEVRLKQVVLNLLTNAIKYNKEGGQVKVSSSKSKTGFIQIRVTDTGLGISDKELEDLFVPFYRSVPKNSNIPGTGIGLSLTKALVEQMGGTLEVKSKLGEGSTFIVSIPVGKEINTAKTKKANEDFDIKEIKNPKYIFYIEDNPMNSLLMTEALKKFENLSLKLSEDPIEGIKLIEEQMPDLILLDINLPHMSGYDVLKHLRENEKLKNIPVIAVTACATSKDRIKLDSAGFDEALIKPINMTKLYRTIHKYL